MVLELTGSPFHTDAGLHPVRTMLERRCGIDRGTDQAQRLRLLETTKREDFQRIHELGVKVADLEATIRGYERALKSLLESEGSNSAVSIYRRP